MAQEIAVRDCDLHRSTIRAMPEYELFYFPITGLGEPLRLVFVLGGVPFKDTTPANDPSFQDRKAAIHPYAPEAGGLPVLTIDGKPFAQSRAILRYLGRVCSYEGAPLYPSDPMEQLECDEMIEMAEDLRGPLLGTFAVQDEAEKLAARAALVAEDGKMTKWLKIIDRMLGKKFPTKPTIGTVYLWSLVTMLRQPTFLDGIPADALAPYANIAKLHQYMSQLPPILEHYAKAEKRDNFKPLP